MYKKITHTIIEEHFDCPEAVDIAASIENGIMPMRFRITPTANIISESDFKTNIEDYIFGTNLNWLNLLEATFDKSLDYETAIERAYSTVDGLGNSLKVYYGVEFGERLNQLLRASLTNLMYIWRNEFNGWDNSMQKSRLYELLTPGASTLFTQYNQLWDRNTVDSTLNTLYESYIDLGTAYKTKNTLLQSELETKISSTWSQFATMLSSGVIRQFPAYFTA